MNATRRLALLGLLALTPACAKHAGSASGAAPVPTAQAIRPDTFAGTSVPAVSLQDGKRHPYVFASASGARFDLALDTRPSASELQLTISEGGRLLSSQTVKTPFAKTLSGTGDGVFEVSIQDAKQANVTLSSLSVQRTTPSFSSTSFKAFVHIAGPQAVPAADDATFVAALLDGVNAIYASSGIQIDVAGSGSRRLTVAEVTAADPTLVLDGKTILDARDTVNPTARPARWGNLGIDESDPQFGDAVDIFVVSSPVGADAIGVANTVQLRGQGGLFRGKGLTHSLVLTLFDPVGRPRPLSVLQKALAHELGHFLSLEHTTDPDFTADDLLDTPVSTAADDTNGDGRLEASDKGGLDAGNLMYPFDRNQTMLTADQGAAMRAYLALREH